MIYIGALYRCQSVRAVFFLFVYRFGFCCFDPRNADIKEKNELILILILVLLSDVVKRCANTYLVLFCTQVLLM